MQTDILGVPVDAQPLDEALATLIAWAHDSHGRRYVCACPVYTLMQARDHDDVRAALRGAAMVTADGMPLVWIQRRSGYAQAERIYGPDVLLALCERTAGTSISHYFYGGLPGVPETLAENLRARFPALRVAGAHSPPVAPLDAAPDPVVIARLNASGAQVIWVGLGSPKQDVWMTRYRPALDAPLLIGVGAAFDFLAGTKAQAPRWMQQRGLEWLFRLLQEPGRLWRRYLVYNTRFLWALMMSRLNTKPP